MRLGFGLNVTHFKMKSVISAMLAQEDLLKNAVSAYIDDLYVDKSILAATMVLEELAFGPVCKDPDQLEDGACVLVLEVWGVNSQLRWKRESTILNALTVMTQRNVISLYEKLVGHLPVCSWLRVVASVIKQQALLSRKDGMTKMASVTNKFNIGDANFHLLQILITSAP